MIPEISTAPGASFSSMAEYKAHFKSDWHRYNLRRKVAGLEMVTKHAFEALREAAKVEASATEQRRDDYSHVKPSKREAQRKKLERRGQAEAGATVKDVVGAYRRSRPDELAAPEREDDPEEEEEETGPEPIVAEARASDSIFDARRLDDVAEALAYMRRVFGFFLPEVEYLVDVEGCLLYLCDKVKQRRTCLYCGQIFRSFRACQQHSIDKGHCKVAFDTEDQLAELANFYDFSRSYDAYDPEDVEALELDEEEEDEWETDDDGEASSAQVRRPLPRVQVLESGELLVRQGDRSKIVGARWLRRYYKQNFRLDDERENTLAVKREQTARVVALYQDTGILDKAKADGFFARGLAAQFNKRALAGSTPSSVSIPRSCNNRHTQASSSATSARKFETSRRAWACTPAAQSATRQTCSSSIEWLARTAVKARASTVEMYARRRERPSLLSPWCDELARILCQEESRQLSPSRE